jgi:hypothetical protein
MVENPDFISIYRNMIAIGTHISSELAMDTVIFEEMGQGLCIGQIVDGRNGDMGMIL